MKAPTKVPTKETSRNKSEFAEIRLATSAGASVGILAYGAHIISWRPASRKTEHLFVSERALYQPGISIRGGVPVVFPQFADRGPLAKHGFARIQPWTLLSNAVLDDGRAQAVLTLTSNDVTRALWPHDFAATYKVTLSDDQLDMQLHIHNTGSQPFEFTAALHTYLAVDDIRASQLHGLQGSDFVQRGREHRETESQEALQFDAAIDRVYFNSNHNTKSPLTLVSPAQHTQLNARGFEDTVVWNPWVEGCATADDMTNEDYQAMLCVEAASVANPIQLHTGESWTGGQTLMAKI